jgi:TnpA family transposase
MRRAIIVALFGSDLQFTSSAGHKNHFLCQYSQPEALRREIHACLNVIENWNGANSFIFYGCSGDFATNRLDEHELAALSLHLLQICRVYVNILLI